MATSPRFSKTVVAVPVVQITDTTLTTILAPNASFDSRITGVNIMTDDTAINNATLYISDGVTDCPVGNIPIPAGSGVTVSIPAVGMMASLPNVFRERDANGVTVLNLPKGNSLKIKMSAVTGGKKVFVLVKAELYD